MRDNSVSIPLKSIEWRAVLEGPLLSYRSVQKYENTSDDTIEINYSFPLPYGKSVIKKFSAEINGVKREARALPKHEAEEKYEKAMESGDSPIMLEIVDKDFCTASLGNLKKGEKAEITVEFLQLVEFNGQRARVKIPTVLDQRYASDDSERPGSYYGVEPNLFADYPCTGELIIRKPFDTGSVSSPTHSIKCTRIKDGLKVEVPKGKANSDFVFDVEVQSEGVLCLAKDSDQWAALASFIPWVEAKEDSLDLSILLDCSGSMYGSRIGWAKNALSEIVTKLKREDKVSLYCFGSSCHLIKLPRSVRWEGADTRTQELLHQSWDEVIAKIDADLGGTELAGAINECGKAFPAKTEKSAILLITDGEVWDKERVIEAAKKTGRRFFVLGIGLAPYDNLLTKIANETGGYYDSVYSASDVEGAAIRVVERLRSPVLSDPKVCWPTSALWTSRDKSSVFAADSYSSAAFLRDPIDSLELTFKLDGEEHSAKVVRLEEDFGEDVVKLVANLRMVSTEDVREQEELGVKYNLAGPRTNFLLVVERAEEDKPEDFAQLAVVPQMVVEDRVMRGMSMCMSAPPQMMYSMADVAEDRPRKRISRSLLDRDEIDDLSQLSEQSICDEQNKKERKLRLAFEMSKLYSPKEFLELDRCGNDKLDDLLVALKRSHRGKKQSLDNLVFLKQMITEAKDVFCELYKDEEERRQEIRSKGKLLPVMRLEDVLRVAKDIEKDPSEFMESPVKALPNFNWYDFVAYLIIMYKLLDAQEEEEDQA